MENKKKAKGTVLSLVLSILLVLNLVVCGVAIALSVANVTLGGSITFNAKHVNATISAGQVTGGTLNGTNKMQAITLDATHDGATEIATWSGLDLEFNESGDDVTISFTITNNSEEFDLASALTITNGTQTNATMTVTATKGGSAVDANSVVIEKKSSEATTCVAYTIKFSVTDKNKSASITDFALSFALEKYVAYTLETIDGKDYIYFGSYPQTIKSSSVTITSDPVDENGYYTGSDGAKYAKVTASIYNDSTDTQYQASDGTQMTTGTDYYFKVEPLRWRVLSNDGSTALIVCDTVITAMAYQKYTKSEDYIYATDASGNILTDNGSQVYANNYKWSELRTFLIGDFYDNAFDTTEQSLIQITTLDNSLASTGDSSNDYVCEDTNDTVFALSYAEATNTNYGFESDDDRTWKVSDYAKASGIQVTKNNGSAYVWLRSPSDSTSNSVQFVIGSGTILTRTVRFTNGSVVPALNLSL